MKFLLLDAQAAVLGGVPHNAAEDGGLSNLKHLDLIQLTPSFKSVYNEYAVATSFRPNAV